MIGEHLFRIFDGEDCNLSNFLEKTARKDEEFQKSYSNLLLSNPNYDQTEWDILNLLYAYASLAFLIGFAVGGQAEICQEDGLLEIQTILSILKKNNILPYFPRT